MSRRSDAGLTGMFCLVLTFGCSQEVEQTNTGSGGSAPILDAASESPEPDSGLDGGPDAAPDAAPDTGADAEAGLAPGHFELPTPTGPYGIARGGRRTLIDTSRGFDGASPDGGTPRTLSVEAWYPTAPSVPDDTVPYMDEAEAGIHGWNTAIVARVHTHAHAKAPFADNLGPRPLLVFSPGYSTVPRMYTAYFEELVSHGYVVVAVSHSLWTPVTTLADGSLVWGTWNSNSLSDQTSAQAQAATWLADLVFVLDELVKSNDHDPLDELTGNIDLSRVGAFGHSFGGAAALNLVAADPRVVAAVAFDPCPQCVLAPAEIPRPMLFFASSGGYWNTSLFNAATGPAYRAMMTGFGHMSFSDYGLLAQGLGFIAPGQIGNADATRSVISVEAYVKAFMDLYLLGIPTTFLDGPSPDYPEVKTFEKRP